MLKTILSPMYQKWIPDDVQGLKISESWIDCSDCRMTREKRGSRARVVYDGHLKCCTFEPFLPNFHVGALLMNPNYETRITDILTEKWRTKDIVIPLGMVASLNYQFEFKNREPNDFGNRADLLCGYFDKDRSQCGIWMYRGAVCTSFYCSSQYGPRGKKFWKTLGEYLSLLDMFVAEEVIADMGFSPRQISAQLQWLKAEDVPAQQKKDAARAILDLWPLDLRDPIVFFRECYNIAKDYSLDRVQESMGELGQAKLKQLLKGKALEHSERKN